MRTAVSHLQGHIADLQSEVEHVAAGALRHDWTPAQRDKISLNERAIAILEQVAHERLADVDAEVAKRYPLVLAQERLNEWWRGYATGVATAVRVVEDRCLDVSWWERSRVRHIFEGLARLQDQSAKRRG